MSNSMTVGELVAAALTRLGIARVVGLPHWRAQSVEQAGAALTNAFAVDGPALVEIDMQALGDFPNAALPPRLRPKED